MRKTRLLVLPGVLNLDDGKTMIQVTNPNEHVYTLEANINMANFRKRTPHQFANISPKPVEHLKWITEHPDVAAAVINHFFVKPEMKSTKWYPTPEACNETDKLNQIAKLTFDEIVPLRELEKLDPTRSHDERVKFM